MSSGRSICLRYATPQDDVLRVERDDDSGDAQVVASCADADVEDTIDDISCKRCGAFNDDGEGCDGLCGNCADKADAAGESAWHPGRRARRSAARPQRNTALDR